MALAWLTLNFQALLIGLDWLLTATDPLQAYLRGRRAGRLGAVGAGGAAAGGAEVVAGRPLAGRQLPAVERPLSAGCTMRQLMRFNPMVLFAGSPLLNGYLRLLGAQVGAHAHIATPVLPVCTDLIRIGDDSLIGRQVRLPGCRAEAGRMWLGPVEIGQRLPCRRPCAARHRHPHAGSAASSAMPRRCCAARRWSPACMRTAPAQPTPTEFLPGAGAAPADGAAPPAVCAVAAAGAGRRVAAAAAVGSCGYAVGRAGTAARGALRPASARSQPCGALGRSGRGRAGRRAGAAGRHDAVGAAGFTTLPRLLSRAIVPGRLYRFYGLHHWLLGLITAWSNSRWHNMLAGDSPDVVAWLRAVVATALSAASSRPARTSA